jgi:hypothetical protein
MLEKPREFQYKWLDWQMVESDNIDPVVVAKKSSLKFN